MQDGKGRLANRPSACESPGARPVFDPRNPRTSNLRVGPSIASYMVRGAIALPLPASAPQHFPASATKRPRAPSPTAASVEVWKRDVTHMRQPNGLFSEDLGLGRSVTVVRCRSPTKAVVGGGAGPGDLTVSGSDGGARSMFGEGCSRTMAPRGLSPHISSPTNRSWQRHGGDVPRADRSISLSSQRIVSSESAKNCAASTVEAFALSTTAARRAPRTIAKPPRPPGPPPPHILLEQKKRREMMAIQRAGQSDASEKNGERRDLGIVQGAVNETQQSPQRQKERNRGGQRSPGQQLVQAGERILGYGEHNFSLSSTMNSSSASSEAHLHGGLSTSLGITGSGAFSAVGRTTEMNEAPGVGQVSLASTRKTVTDWQEFWDDEVEASYYYNSVTREAQWVRPDGF